MREWQPPSVFSSDERASWVKKWKFWVIWGIDALADKLRGSKPKCDSPIRWILNYGRGEAYKCIKINLPWSHPHQKRPATCQDLKKRKRKVVLSKCQHLKKWKKRRTNIWVLPHASKMKDIRSKKWFWLVLNTLCDLFPDLGSFQFGPPGTLRKRNTSLLACQNIRYSLLVPNFIPLSPVPPIVRICFVVIPMDRSWPPRNFRHLRAITCLWCQ